MEIEREHLYAVSLYNFKRGSSSMRLSNIRNRRMASSGMLRHVALVRTDVPEELSTSIIRVNF
jgi:hypothetical protein